MRAAARMVAVAAACDCWVGLCLGARRAEVFGAARRVGFRSAVIDRRYRQNGSGEDADTPGSRCTAARAVLVAVVCDCRLCPARAVLVAVVCDCRLCPAQALTERLYSGVAALRAGLVFHSAVIDAPLQREMSLILQRNDARPIPASIRPRVFPKRPTALAKTAGSFPE